MSDAQKILEMIENVYTEDTDALDEIDARVWCFLNGITLTKIIRYSGNALFGKVKCWRTREYGDIHRLFWSKPIETTTFYTYTRSRNSLKLTRPEGWSISIENDGDIDCFMTCKNPPYHQVSAPALPTEELAELHTIIQAIDYERREPRK